MTQELESPIVPPISTEPKPETPKHADKRPRMLCTVCMNKDSLAVRYYVNTKLKNGKIIRTMEYEHRDEPPIKEYNYKGKIVKSYRRCHAGRVMTLDEATEPTTKDVEIPTKSGTVLIAKQTEKKKTKAK